MDKANNSFNIEKEVWRCWGGGGGVLKFWKIGEVKGGRIKNLAIEQRAWLHEPS